jgi:tetratricopeptide (TPR) repeat protein
VLKDWIEPILFQDNAPIKRLGLSPVNNQSPSSESPHTLKNSTVKADTPKREPRPLTQTLSNEDLSLKLKRINNLIALDNQNADAFYNRGWIYEYKGELEKAIENYTRALDIDASLTDAYYNRGLIYIRQGKYMLAITDFTEVIKQRGGDADVYNNRGNAYMQLNQFESALDDYNTAIGINPNDPDLYYNRGIIYRNRREYRKSRQDFQKAAEMGHKQARQLLGLKPMK